MVDSVIVRLEARFGAELSTSKTHRLSQPALADRFWVLHSHRVQVAMVHEDLPRFLSPMLASSGSPPDGMEWAYEVKFDGIRAQLRLDREKLCLRSRPGRDCTDAFPELWPLSAELPKRRLLLDGELVCLDEDGNPDFGRLRARLRWTGRRHVAALRSPATLLAFDLLHLDGRSTRPLPYRERRAVLAELDLDGPAWCAPRHFVGQRDERMRATRERGLEGVVAKRLDAPDLPGVRSRAWVKHKHRRRETFVVTGWLPAEGRRPESLLVARQGDDGVLAMAGTVSLGYRASCASRSRPSSRSWSSRSPAAGSECGAPSPDSE